MAHPSPKVVLQVQRRGGEDGVPIGARQRRGTFGLNLISPCPMASCSPGRELLACPLIFGFGLISLPASPCHLCADCGYPDMHLPSEAHWEERCGVAQRVGDGGREADPTSSSSLGDCELRSRGAALASRERIHHKAVLPSEGALGLRMEASSNTHGVSCSTPASDPALLWTMSGYCRRRRQEEHLTKR